MPLWSSLIAWTGVAVLASRLRRGAEEPASPASLPIAAHPPRVSIIVPARDEEAVLPRLLESLGRLTYPHREIIVVDDQSTDGTAELARAAGARLISGTAPPEGWNGKNWACHQGARAASGDVLLFTDADTRHEPGSLERALALMEAERIDLLSALPYHENPSRWERLLGPFHALVYCATAPRSPRPGRLFAIGQYLLFRRDLYDRIGGHEAVAGKYPDDLALANACLGIGGRYRVHMGEPLYSVRMYPTLGAFVRGWRRNFLAGLQQSSLSASTEVVLAVCALTGMGTPFRSASLFLASAAAVVIILRRQKSWGRFSAAGPFLWPFALALHVLITALALFDWARGNTLEWKGRRYSGWVDGQRSPRP